MPKTPDERRAFPRIEINGEITYQAENSGDSYQGELENLSIGGARIWTDRELPTNSQILFQVESNDVEEVTQEFSATLLHELAEKKQSKFGYGLIIKKPRKNRN